MGCNYSREKMEYEKVKVNLDARFEGAGES